MQPLDYMFEAYLVFILLYIARRFYVKYLRTNKNTPDLIHMIASKGKEVGL